MQAVRMTTQQAERKTLLATTYVTTVRKAEAWRLERHNRIKSYYYGSSSQAQSALNLLVTLGCAELAESELADSLPDRGEADAVRGAERA